MSADPESNGPGRSDRRTFLRTSGGIATGIAVTVLPTGAVALASAGGAQADEPAGRRIEAEGDVPHETVMAYVHDADKGIVTVVSGTGEKTYHDPALTKRLIDAAARTA